MKPIDLSISEAIAKIDSGGIRENARARVALQRGLHKLGFVPQLNAWVRDLPPGLRDRFDNLGLGDTCDPRGIAPPALPPAHEEPAKPAAGDPPRNMHLADDGTGKMVPVGKPTRIQTLHTEHDRLKLAQLYVDAKLGPMVRLDLAERPILAAKNVITAGKENAVRQDVSDLRVPLPKVTVKDAGSGFVPLGEAMRRMRSRGAGDANSEALLQRLADHLPWIPQLGMSVAQASGALTGA